MATEAEPERKHEGDICDTYSDFDADYDKIKQLGRAGQYGTTYLCSVKHRDDAIPHTIDNPSRVAVKIINKQRFKDSGPRIYAKWLELQKNEITTLLLARHPNIVRLYRVMEDPLYVYLVMEYLPGGELLDFIVKTGKVSEFKVAHVLGQVLSALDYMHQRDILHLDLKPENVMLVDQDYEVPTVKLIDFGFAAVLPRLEKMVGNRGTPYYMAPEVWRGEYDRSADVWACGVICFVMLFGFLPFYDDHSKGGKPNIKEIKRQIKKGFHENETKRGCGPWFPRAIPVSNEAKYFISHVLRMDVKRRYTVEEALGDPWLRGHASEDTLPEIVMRGLSQFSGATQNNRGLAFLVADVSELNSTKLETTDSFEAGYAVDGKIMKNEFVTRFGALCNMRRLEMETMFDDLDTDNDGYITIETVRMVEKFHHLISVDDRLHDLFDKLDADGDGVIGEADLSQAMNDVSPEVQQLLDVRTLLEVTDANQDGVIDKDEFMQALHPSNFEPTTSLQKDARDASKYATSIRQKSALYYDLLKQCESGIDEDPSGNLSPRAQLRQLTVDKQYARPESIAEMDGETDNEDEPYDPRDHLDDDDLSLDVEAVLADANTQKNSKSPPVVEEPLRADTLQKRGMANEYVQHFGGPSAAMRRESEKKGQPVPGDEKRVEPDHGAGGAGAKQCCAIL